MMQFFFLLVRFISYRKVVRIVMCVRSCCFCVDIKCKDDGGCTWKIVRRVDILIMQL
jgi:hypothetical protein